MGSKAHPWAREDQALKPSMAQDPKKALNPTEKAAIAWWKLADTPESKVSILVSFRACCLLS